MQVATPPTASEFPGGIVDVTLGTVSGANFVSLITDEHLPQSLCLQQRGVTQDHAFHFSMCPCVCGRNSIRTRYVRVLVYLCITFSLCAPVNLKHFELSSVCAFIVRTSTHQHTYIRTHTHASVNVYLFLCVLFLLCMSVCVSVCSGTTSRRRLEGSRTV